MDIVLHIDGVVLRIAVKGLFDCRVIGDQRGQCQALGLVVTGKKAAVGPDFDQGTILLLRIIDRRRHPGDTAADGIDEEADGAGFEYGKEEVFLFSGEHSSSGEGLVGGRKPRLDQLDVHGVVGCFGLEGPGGVEAELQISVDRVIPEGDDKVLPLGAGGDGENQQQDGEEGCSNGQQHRER